MMIHLELRQSRCWIAAIIAIATIFGMSPQLSAQGNGPVSDVYLITTFGNNDNVFRYSQPVYVVNPGTPDGSRRCANIYVFDAINEMIECCSCPVGDDGLLVVSVKDLTSNSLVGTVPKNGTIKIVSNDPGDAMCGGAQLDDPSPTLRAWMTHIQIANTRPNIFAKGLATPTLNVLPFDLSPLSETERSFLPVACSFVQYLGMGIGTCSCPPAPVGNDS